jgi:hypothetical protein
MSEQTATTTKWFQEGDFRYRCQDCRFKGRSKSSPQAKVKRHAAEFGHRVEVERTMWKLVSGSTGG